VGAPETFDLIVVGAGPGGSSATAHALRAGLRVCQLDAARFPRTKPCAGGLTTKALRALPLELGPALRGAHEAFEFNAWRSARTVYSFSAPVLTMVARPELDDRLVRENRTHPGLTFRDGEAVRDVAWSAGRFHVQSASGAVSAPQLVAADGAHGIVARRFGAGAPRARAVAVEVVLPRAELLADPVPRPCFDFGAVPRGYGWVFPKDDQVSVGLYSLARGQKDLRGQLEAYGAAKGLRWRGDVLASFEAHTIPLGGHDLAAPTLPLYPVGDAAGLADALTGEGIYHALESGRIAGELAARVARGEESPARYRELLERPVLRDTRWSWRLAGPFYWRPDLALRLLARSGLWRPLVQGSADGATFSASLSHGLGLALRSLRAGGARRSTLRP